MSETTSLHSNIYLSIWLCWVSDVVYGTFSCMMWDLVPRLGIEPRPSALGACSFSHWGSTTLDIRYPLTFILLLVLIISWYLYSLTLGFRDGSGTPLQYSCLKNPMDRAVWWAAVHGVAKSRTRLSDFTFAFHFHALEKEMATYSTILAWRIMGTGEPAVYGVSQSQTRLKQLSSSSSSNSWIISSH